MSRCRSTWDFPSQLSSQNGWGFFTVVVLVAALVLGVLEGLPLRFGPHGLGWAVAALALAIGLVGASFFLGDLFSAGGEQSTATRDDVVMSQLTWAAFWLAHTVVVAAVLTLRPRRY